MRKFNLVVPKTYTKDGEEKTAWNRVGTLVHFPATEEKQEGYLLELNMFPNTKFGVFEEKKREETTESTGESQVDTEPDNEEDIPF